MERILGLHHMTFMAGHPQVNHDFYTHELGLRLVKTTINFDAPDVYHLYFGDEAGNPGSILTSFPFPNMRRGQRGQGQMTFTALGIPKGSYSFWRDRLEERNLSFDEIETAFGQKVLRFEDPDGLGLMLVESESGAGKGWGGGSVPAQHAIQGMDAAILEVARPEATARLLTEVMDYEELDAKGPHLRLKPRARHYGYIELQRHHHVPAGRLGAGIVHHLAFATPSDELQLELRAQLLEYGMFPTEVKDRQYFHSVYFREPNGVLFEIATVPPGFAVDEAPDALGQELRLPPWEENRRNLIEQALPVIDRNPDKSATA